MTPTKNRSGSVSRRSSGGRPADRPGASSRRSLVVVAVVALAVVAALVVALIAGGNDDGDTAATPATATADGDDTAADAADGRVAVSGEVLVPRPDAGDDPAVGQPMPTLSGTTFDGEQLTVPATGRPALVLFVAHWCPHCQREVPVVQQWVDQGDLPEAVDLVTVSTAIDPRRPNYPPADWLAREGWTAPVLTDGDGAAATAAGLTGYPFFVAVDAAGRVVARTSGELTAGQLDSVVAAAASG